MKNKPTYLSHNVQLLTWVKAEHKTDKTKDVWISVVPEGAFYIKYFEKNISTVEEVDSPFGRDFITNEKKYWSWRTKFIPSNKTNKKIKQWHVYKNEWFARLEDNKCEAEIFLRNLRDIKDLDLHPLLQNTPCLYIHELHQVEAEHKEIIRKNIEKTNIIIFQTEKNTHVVKNPYGKVLSVKSWKKWQKENLL